MTTLQSRLQFPILFASMALCLTARADLWVSVAGSDSNPGTEAAPFLSIQAAIDAAPAEGCDIHVAEGTHYVKSGTSPEALLMVSKPVRIIASGRRENTIIDAQRKRPLAYVSNGGALISGFTMRKGYSHLNNISTCYCGVFITQGVVSNCVIESCLGYYAVGARVAGGKLIDCEVRDNESDHSAPNGVGIRLTSGLVSGCDIHGNFRANSTGGVGGGIHASGGTVTNCHIHGNTMGRVGFSSASGAIPSVSMSGSGVYMDNAAALVTDCLIEENGIVGRGAGVGMSNGTLRNCVVRGNTSTNVFDRLFNCGVYMTGGIITNCIVTANTGRTGCEGLYQTNGKIFDTIVAGNGRYDFRSTGGTRSNICTNNPAFADGIGGNYRLTAASPCAGIACTETLPGFGCAFSQDATTVRVEDEASGAPVVFTATSVGGSGAVTYSWDFGDGTTGTGETVTHNYSSGVHSVTLTATDSGGNSSSSSAKDCVYALPRKVYVSKTGSATYPYTTSATATADILAAMDLHPLEIEVGEGTYSVARAPLMMCEPIHVKGVGDRENVVFDAANTANSHVALMSHEDAVLEGATLYRATTSASWHSGGGAVISAGLVTNCVFKNNTSYRAPQFFMAGGKIVDSLITGGSCGGGNTYAEAAEMTGGSLIGCTITKPGSIGSSSGKGILYVNGNSAVVSNCFIYGNDIGGVAKDNTGGGIYMAKGLVVNTVISNNTASVTGGGVYMSGGTLRGCLVAGNKINKSAGSNGGGIYNAGGTIENCTVVGNTTTIAGGGIYQTAGSTVNSVVYYNNSDDLVATGGTVTYTASSETIAGEGNTTAEPSFIGYGAQDYRFTSLARDFIDKGTPLPWMSGAVDLLGQERVNGSAPDIGAIEYYPSADEAFLAEFSAPVLSAKLSLSTTFTASISKYDIGDCTFAWDFGDGTPAQSGVGLATNAHTFASAGLFTVSLTVTPPAGSADAAQTVSRAGYILVIPGTCYVSPDGGNTPPYATWETAARSINDAYDVGSDRIVVTNGTYSLKALTVGRAVEIVSVEGASKTTCSSAEAGYNLVTLGAAGAFLDGFTLRGASISDWQETTGGCGLRVIAGEAANCIVRNCQKYSYGCTYVGGTGRLRDSLLINNHCGANSSRGAALYVASGGYVSGCVVTNNTSAQSDASDECGGIGLFIVGGTVSNCVFAGNSATSDGSRAGGVNILGGLVTHCVITNNSVVSYSGGVQQKGGVLRNCLIAGNRCTGSATGMGVGGLWLKGGLAESLTIAGNSSTLSGGGVRQSGGVLLNSIVYGNVSPDECDLSGGVRTNCFSATAMNGEGCLGGDPLFKDAASGDYSLEALSSAKNAGTNQVWMVSATDLAGEDRIQGEIVDIGAYEVDASAVVPFSTAFAITASEKLPSGNTTVSFEASVAGATGAVTYHWDFGDGTTLDTADAACSHTYAPGAYTVTLRAYDTGSGDVTDPVVREDYAVALPDVCHVAQGEGVTPKYPYVTPATGAASVADALTVGAAEIIVHPGTYTISSVIPIGYAVHLHSASGNPADTVIFAPDVDGLRVVNLQHAGAVISGLTLKGGRMLGEGGAVLKMTGGVVTNCVLVGGVNYYSGSVIISNGRIVDCVIRGAWAGHSVQAASALTINGGVVDRCVITNNSTSAAFDGSTRGEAVTLDGSGAVLRNSLIAWNKGHEAAGVRVVNAMEFSNCTVVTNTARVKCAGVRFDGRPVTCANNIVWGNVAPANPDTDQPLYFTYSCGPALTTGTGNVADDPFFRNPQAGDWRLAPGSPAIDAGRWEVAGATKTEVRAQRDLVGGSRLVRLNIDMGCYETPNPEGTMILLR